MAAGTEPSRAVPPARAVSRRGGETRRAMLVAAARLLQTRGYHGFSFHHVAEVLGVRPAAVHYHFPVKADLGVALIAGFRDDFDWWRGQSAARSAAGRDRLERFFELDGRYAEQGWVCPLGVVGVEYGGLPQPVRDEADALLDAVADYLTETLTIGRADGTLRVTGDAGEAAWAVLAATQGALQLSRIQGRAGYERVLRALRVQLTPPA